MQNRIAVGIQLLGLFLAVVCFATNAYWAWQSEKMRGIIRDAQQDRADEFVDRTRKQLKGSEKKGSEKTKSGDANAASRSNPDLDRAQQKLFQITRNRRRFGWTLVGVSVVGLCMAVVGMVLGRRFKRESKLVGGSKLLDH